MQEFDVSEWRRFGKDRTYVVDVATGVQIGYRDNVSGELVPADASTARVLGRWAELHHAGVATATVPALAGSASAAESPHQAIDHADVVTVLAPVDEDLSMRRPGEAARARALEELAARRVEVGRLRTWFGRLTDARTDERSWRIGADAEESIGAELDGLARHGWRVLHSVPVGAAESDIDHVLVGPAGVFTVNSKHHPGAKVWVAPRQVRVNGHPVPYLRNSRHEATRAWKLLSAAAGVPVSVQGILIFRLGSGSLTVRERPEDVLVYRATGAAASLRALPAILDDRQIERVFDVARWRSTWQPR